MINQSAIFQQASEPLYQPPPAINQSAIFQPATWVPNQPQSEINHGQSTIFQPATQIRNQPVINQSAIFQPAAQAPNQALVINPLDIAQPATQIPNQLPLLLVDQQSSSDELQLDDAICKCHTLYPVLSFTKIICDKGESIEVTQCFLYHLSGATYLSVARVLFIPSELPIFTYEVQVLFTMIFSGIVQTFNKFFAVCNVMASMKRVILISTMLLFTIMSRESVFVENLLAA